MIISQANRLDSVEEYYFSKKLEEIRQLNREGRNVINLGIGSPDLMPSGKTIDTLITNAQQPDSHGYQSYRSIPELRAAIGRWYHKTYGVQIDAMNEILPLIGSKEGIMHISMAFLNHGDQVLIPDPGYPTYRSVSNLVGAQVLTYDLNPANNWKIDVEKLRNLNFGKVKIMWINFPHMPTGVTASREILVELIGLAKEKRFLLVNDNPYSLVLNDKPQSLMSIPGSYGVALELNSLSKSHNMAGWRLGWVVGRKDYVDTILKVKSNMDSGMFLPIQRAAIQALENSVEWHRQRNLTYSKRRELVWKIFDSLDCEFEKDQVGLFVWARLPEKVTDPEQFVNDILYKASVFITPGFIFGKNGTNYLRISLCTTEEKLMEALDRIKSYLKSQN